MKQVHNVRIVFCMCVVECLSANLICANTNLQKDKHIHTRAHTHGSITITTACTWDVHVMNISDSHLCVVGGIQISLWYLPWLWPQSMSIPIELFLIRCNFYTEIRSKHFKTTNSKTNMHTPHNTQNGSTTNFEAAHNFNELWRLSINIRICLKQLIWFLTNNRWTFHYYYRHFVELMSEYVVWKRREWTKKTPATPTKRHMS